MSDDFDPQTRHEHDKYHHEMAQLEAELAAARVEVERLSNINESLRKKLSDTEFILEQERIWAIPQVGDPKLVVGLMQQAKDELASAHAEVERLRADNRRHKDAVLALTKRCEEAREIIKNSPDLLNMEARLMEWLEGK